MTADSERLAGEGLATGLSAMLAEHDPARAGALDLAVRSLLAELEQGSIALTLEPARLRELWAECGLAGPDRIEDWLASLRASPLLADETEAVGQAPLVVSGERLYLRRYYRIECRIAERLQQLANQQLPAPVVRSEDWAGFFPDSKVPAPDWQRIAAWAVLRRGFCVISGGPGTGKTSTLVRVLALLSRAEPDLRIALAAPTGKAAMRMGEAARAELARLEPGAGVPVLPEAQTLHRLLGLGGGRRGPRYGAEQPLPYDLVAVDEASMLDVDLMQMLLDAIGDGCRLVLLGDHNQLQSVEAGSVLNDICMQPAYGASFRAELEQALGIRLDGDADAAGPLSDQVVFLRHSWRFGAGSELGALAGAVLDGNVEAARCLLQSGRDLELGSVADLLAGRGLEAFVGPFRSLLDAVANGDAAGAFAALRGYRILCAVRAGPLGVERINAVLETLLRREPGLTADGDWYPGRVIMVTVNDYRNRLFNGDVGIVIEQDGELRVAFDAEDGLRLLAPARLPRHETAFAMTVHKSQGSEFDRIALILPDRSSPVLNRALVYTGITRARRGLTLYAAEPVLTGAIERVPRRISGLRQRLWGDAPGATD